MGIFDKLLGLTSIAPPATAIPTDQPTGAAKFEKKQMKKVEGGYLLMGANKALFSSDLESINPLLDDARRLVQGVPRYKLDASKLVFTEKFDKGTRKNVLLKFTPLTTSGRMPKYPIEIHFTVNISEDFFGTVYYGQSGRIEKAEIILWKSNTGYVINLKAIDSVLSINQIFKSIPRTGERVKVYQR